MAALDETTDPKATSVVVFALVAALFATTTLAQTADTVSAEDWAPLTRQGLAASRDGDAEAALVWFERALAAAEGFEEDDPRRATAMGNLAMQRQRNGVDEGVETLLLDALALRQRALGQQHVRVADAYADLARFYDEQGDFASADAHLRDALLIREALLGPSAPESMATIDALAAIAVERRDLEQSARWLGRSAALAQDGQGDADVTQRYRLLAALAVQDGQASDAERWLRAGLDALANGPETDAERVLLLQDLTRLLVHDRRSREAMRILEEAIEVTPAPALVLELATLQVAHSANEAALELLDGIRTVDATERAEVGMIAARAHRQAGHLEEASAAIEGALVQLSIAAGELGDVPAELEVELRLERALLLAAKDDQIAALAAFEAVLGLEEAMWGANSPLLAPTIEAMEHLHVRAGDITAAAALRERRQALMR